MRINDDLILKWEPKIQKMVSNVFVLGMERDDIAQELNPLGRMTRIEVYHSIRIYILLW